MIMDRATLRAIQTPLKERYQANPADAVAEMRVIGKVTFQPPGCLIDLPPNNGREVTSGLHPFAGGDGSLACAGDMLLQSLVACAGTTLAVVSIAMELPIRAATINAVGVMDFRGTLAVDRSVPVGMTSISVHVDLTAEISSEQAEKLVQLTERYCVVYQTLRNGVAISTTCSLSTT